MGCNEYNLFSCMLVQINWKVYLLCHTVPCNNVHQTTSMRSINLWNFQSPLLLSHLKSWNCLTAKHLLHPLQRYFNLVCAAILSICLATLPLNTNSYIYFLFCMLFTLCCSIKSHTLRTSFNINNINKCLKIDV